MDTQALVEHLEAAGDLLKQEQPEQALMHLLDVYEAGFFDRELGVLLRRVDENLSQLPPDIYEVLADLQARSRQMHQERVGEELSDFDFDFSISDFFEDLEEDAFPDALEDEQPASMIDVDIDGALEDIPSFDDPAQHIEATPESDASGQDEGDIFDLDLSFSVEESGEYSREQDAFVLDMSFDEPSEEQEDQQEELDEAPPVLEDAPPEEAPAAIDLEELSFEASEPLFDDLDALEEQGEEPEMDDSLLSFPSLNFESEAKASPDPKDEASEPTMAGMPIEFHAEESQESAPRWGGFGEEGDDDIDAEAESDLGFEIEQDDEIFGVGDEGLFEASIGEFAREQSDEDSEEVMIDVNLGMDDIDFGADEEIEDIALSFDDGADSPEDSLLDEPPREEEEEEPEPLFERALDVSSTREAPLYDPSILESLSRTSEGHILEEIQPEVLEESSVEEPLEEEVVDDEPAPVEPLAQDAVEEEGVGADPSIGTFFDSFSFPDEAENPLDEDSAPINAASDAPSLEGFFDEDQTQAPWFDMGSSGGATSSSATSQEWEIDEEGDRTLVPSMMAPEEQLDGSPRAFASEASVEESEPAPDDFTSEPEDEEPLSPGQGDSSSAPLDEVFAQEQPPAMQDEDEEDDLFDFSPASEESPRQEPELEEEVPSLEDEDDDDDLFNLTFDAFDDEEEQVEQDNSPSDSEPVPMTDLGGEDDSEVSEARQIAASMETETGGGFDLGFDDLFSQGSIAEQDGSASLDDFDLAFGTPESEASEQEDPFAAFESDGAMGFDEEPSQQEQEVPESYQQDDSFDLDFDLSFDDEEPASREEEEPAELDSDIFAGFEESQPDEAPAEAAQVPESYQQDDGFDLSFDLSFDDEEEEVNAPEQASEPELVFGGEDEEDDPFAGFGSEEEPAREQAPETYQQDASFDLDFDLSFGDEDSLPISVEKSKPRLEEQAPETYQQDDSFDLDFDLSFDDEEEAPSTPDMAAEVEVPERPSWLSAGALEVPEDRPKDPPTLAQVPGEDELREDSLFDILGDEDDDPEEALAEMSMGKLATIQHETGDLLNTPDVDNDAFSPKGNPFARPGTPGGQSSPFDRENRDATAVFDREKGDANLFQSLLENSRSPDVSDEPEEDSLRVSLWGDSDPNTRETQSNPAIELEAHSRETRANPALTPELIAQSRTESARKEREPTAESPGLFEDEDWSVAPEPAGMPGLEDDWFSDADFAPSEEPHEARRSSIHEDKTAVPGITGSGEGNPGEYGGMFADGPAESAAKPVPQSGFPFSSKKRDSGFGKPQPAPIQAKVEEEDEDDLFDFDLGFDGPQIEEVQSPSLPAPQPDPTPAPAPIRVSSPTPIAAEESDPFDFDLGLSSPDIRPAAMAEKARAEAASASSPGQFSREKTPAGKVEPNLLGGLLGSDSEASGEGVRGTMFGMPFKPNNSQPGAKVQPEVSASVPDVSEDEFFALAESLAAEHSVAGETKSSYRGEPVMNRPPSRPLTGRHEGFDRSGSLSRENPFAHEAPTGVRKALVDSEKARNAFGTEESEPPLIELTPQEEARELYEDGRFAEARELILGVISEGGAPWASEMLDSVEGELERAHIDALGSLTKTPVLDVKMSMLPQLNLDHRSGFLLSQIDGFMTFEDILDLSAMSRLETLEVLVELANKGVIVAT